jgi:hypothetical protein
MVEKREMLHLHAHKLDRQHMPPQNRNTSSACMFRDELFTHVSKWSGGLVGIKQAELSQLAEEQA